MEISRKVLYRRSTNQKRKVMPMKTCKILAIVAIGTGTGAMARSTAWAETVTLVPIADTTLHQKFPDQNVGGHFDFAAGAIMSGERTRALLRFDFAGKLPVTATINSAKLTLQVTRQPSNGGSDSMFELRRVKKSWGEGTQLSSSGAPAAEGEATWNSRLHPNMAWTTPGGAAGGDFAEMPSAMTLVSGRGAHAFASNSQLVADVQSWLENPAENFGWVLMSREENKPETARRFASREDPANAPTLTIDYSTGGSTEFHIANLGVGSTNLTLAWAGGIGPFQAQRRTNIVDAAWENFGPIVAASPISLPFAGEMSFFRIVQTTNSTGTPPASTNQPPAEPPPPPAAIVQYEVTFKSDWSPSTHPQNFPFGAHWSPLIGGTHNSNVTFWAEGAFATQGIEDVAELGSVVNLRKEVNAAIADGTANAVLTRAGSISPNSTATIAFGMSRDFPLVTLVTMIAPSPDWFTGVHGLSLIENGQWVDKKIVALDLYDAGTDSGATYTSLDADTQPHERIRQITGFPALVNGQLVPFGTFTFIRK